MCYYSRGLNVGDYGNPTTVVFFLKFDHRLVYLQHRNAVDTKLLVQSAVLCGNADIVATLSLNAA